MRIIKNKKGLGLRPFTMSIVMIILFSFLILGFVGNYIQATNPSSEILDSKYGLNQSINNMNQTLSTFSEFSDSIRKDLGSSNPSAVDFLFLIFKGAFYIPLAFLGFVFTGFTMITTTLFPTLAGTGLGSLLSIVIGVLFSGVIVTIVLLIVKAIRTGEGER